MQLQKVKLNYSVRKNGVVSNVERTMELDQNTINSLGGNDSRLTVVKSLVSNFHPDAEITGGGSFEIIEDKKSQGHNESQANSKPAKSGGLFGKLAKGLGGIIKDELNDTFSNLKK